MATAFSGAGAAFGLRKLPVTKPKRERSESEGSSAGSGVRSRKRRRAGSRGVLARVPTGVDDGNRLQATVTKFWYTQEHGLADSNYLQKRYDLDPKAGGVFFKYMGPCALKPGDVIFFDCVDIDSKTGELSLVNVEPKNITVSNSRATALRNTVEIEQALEDEVFRRRSDRPQAGNRKSEKVELTGYIKFWSQEKARGFLEGPEIFKKYGSDLFCRADCFTNSGEAPITGEKVLVSEVVRARDQRHHLAAKVSLVGRARLVKTQTRTFAQRLEAVVVRWFEKDGFGFLESEDITAQYGQPVFFHRANMDNPDVKVQPGSVVYYDEVTFGKNNVPKAIGVRIRFLTGGKLTGASAAGRSATLLGQKNSDANSFANPFAQKSEENKGEDDGAVDEQPDEDHNAEEDEDQVDGNDYAQQGSRGPPKLPSRMAGKGKSDFQRAPANQDQDVGQPAAWPTAISKGKTGFSAPQGGAVGNRSASSSSTAYNKFSSGRGANSVSANGTIRANQGAEGMLRRIPGKSGAKNYCIDDPPVADSYEDEVQQDEYGSYDGSWADDGQSGSWWTSKITGSKGKGSWGTEWKQRKQQASFWNSWGNEAECPSDGGDFESTGQEAGPALPPSSPGAGFTVRNPAAYSITRQVLKKPTPGAIGAGGFRPFLDPEAPAAGRDPRIPVDDQPEEPEWNCFGDMACMPLSSAAEEISPDHGTSSGAARSTGSGSGRAVQPKSAPLVRPLGGNSTSSAGGGGSLFNLRKVESGKMVVDRNLPSRANSTSKNSYGSTDTFADADAAQHAAQGGSLPSSTVGDHLQGDDPFDVGVAEPPQAEFEMNPFGSDADDASLRRMEEEIAAAERSKQREDVREQNWKAREDAETQFRHLAELRHQEEVQRRKLELRERREREEAAAAAPENSSFLEWNDESLVTPNRNTNTSEDPREKNKAPDPLPFSFYNTTEMLLPFPNAVNPNAKRAESKTLLFKGLPSTAPTDLCIRFFKKAGKVTDFRFFLMQNDPSKHVGRGLVTYSTLEQAGQAYLLLNKNRIGNGYPPVELEYHKK
ncbi:unnamed protein product [Amoebophrya sp. A25]|nr:unnamed protein product [Amoebophrya sp. A25]|eukprot:GSA25T00002039001.1